MSTTTAIATLKDQMAALHEGTNATYPQGSAVYLDSQVWTVGLELDGLAEITRNGHTRFVGVDVLSPVTAQDEFRGAAFAYLKR